MELTKILEIMTEPEKIIDPRQANVIGSYLSGFITDKEELLNEQNYQVSVKWAEIRLELKSNAEVDRAIELTDIYRERERNKLKISQLKRHRADIRDRFLVLTQFNR